MYITYISDYFENLTELCSFVTYLWNDVELQNGIILLIFKI